MGLTNIFIQSHLQHTQTHSTRLVALTSDTKRTKCTQQTSSVPMPLPTHTLIKIEDGVSNGNHHHQQATSIYEHEKSIQTASIATAVQTTSDLSNHQSLSAQLYYQHPGLIQIAPQPPQAHQQNGCASIMEANESHHISPPPLQLTTRSASISDPQQEHMVEQTQPEVQVGFRIFNNYLRSLKTSLYKTIKIIRSHFFHSAKMQIFKLRQ